MLRRITPNYTTFADFSIAAARFRWLAGLAIGRGLGYNRRAPRRRACRRIDTANMSRYRKIEVRTWTDEKFRALSPMCPSAQSLWFYLLTGPHTGPIPGLFRAGRAAMAEDLGWALDDFDRVFEELVDAGMARADFRARLVWLPNAVRHNLPENPNIVKAWRAEVPLLPEGQLKDEAVAAIEAQLAALGENFLEAFRQPSRKPRPKPAPEGLPNGLANGSGNGSVNGLANQEQEQQQEQEQDAGEKPALVVQEPQALPAGAPPGAALAEAKAKAAARAVEAGLEPIADDEVRGNTPEQKERNREKLRVVKRVFAYYLERTGRNPRTYTFSDLRRKKGLSRLDEALRMARDDLPNAEVYMLGAVDEMLLSDFHMGLDPRSGGHKYIEWDKNLFNTTQQFERWINRAEDAR